MGGHVLLNLLNVFRKRDKIGGFADHYIAFSQNKFNNIKIHHE